MGATLAYDEYREALREYAKKKEKIKEESGMGFYRSSKYEERMSQELRKMVLWLEGKQLVRKEGEDEKEEALPEPEQVIQNRIKEYRKLYPEGTSPGEENDDEGSSGEENEDEGSPDEENIEALKLEYELAKMFEKCVSKLKAIRKGTVWKGTKYEEEDIDYGAAEYTSDRKIEESNKLVNEIVKDGEPFDMLLKDPKRQDAKIDYSEAGPSGSGNKYDPRPLPDEDFHIWGLRHLIHHLLWHAAAVNRNLRSILSRGPMEITVKNLAVKA